MTTATLTEDKTAVLALIHDKVCGSDYDEDSGPQPLTSSGLYALPHCTATGLTDDEVLEKCRTDENGEEFIAYYDQGDLSNVDYDDSRADWYVWGKLVFYCGNDVEQIVRLAEQGAHYRRPRHPAEAEERRKKWQRPDAAYGTLQRNTIAKRLAGRKQEQVYGGGKGSDPNDPQSKDGGKKGKSKGGKQSTLKQALEALNPTFDGEEPGADPNGPAPEHAVAERFHDASGEPYATVPVENHHETYRITGKRMKLWVRYQAFKVHGLALSTAAVNEILELWAARALFAGPVREVAQRISQPDEQAIWLDLGDETHTAVKVTADGWELDPDPPVKFIRKKGSLALPTPTATLAADRHPGKALEAVLRQYTNIAPPKDDRSDHDWVLLNSWLLAALRLRGPFPLLQLKGEQGSAKSTLGRVLRLLVDPHKVDLEPQPGELRDMAIAAQGTWVLAYDNLTKLTEGMSNALCRMSTGGGFRTRQLYTDDEEAIFSFMRPVLLTGVSGVVSRPDLLDRTITLALPHLEKKDRKAERRFWEEFRQDHPAILGALLDVLSLALRAYPAVSPDALPRMADFAQWARAVEVAMGWPAETFTRAYVATERDASDSALAGSPIAEVLLKGLDRLRIDRAWVDEERCVLWAGRMTDLLVLLRQEGLNTTGVERLHDLDVANPGWPRNAWQLAHRVADIKPHLRTKGIDIVPGRLRMREYEIIDRRAQAEVEENDHRRAPGFSFEEEG